MLLTIDRLSSPIGALLLVSDNDGRVRALDFDDYEDRMRRLLKTHCGDTTLAPGRAPAPAWRALDAYFDGDLTAIDDVPVARPAGRRSSARCGPRCGVSRPA